MKKTLFTLSALALTTIVSAQQEQTTIGKEGVTVSAMAGYSEPVFYGLTIEKEQELKLDQRNMSTIFAVYMTDLESETTQFGKNGKGFGIDLGSRLYWQRGKINGFYSQNYISYSQTRFDQEISGMDDGKYSYWSIINGDFGYKFELGNGINLDIFAGYNWKWEVKGKNGIDNKDYDNFVFRAGVKAGYRF